MEIELEPDLSHCVESLARREYEKHLLDGKMITFRLCRYNRKIAHAIEIR